jgi:molecular chaperone GrpE
VACVDPAARRDYFLAVPDRSTPSPDDQASRGFRVSDRRFWADDELPAPTPAPPHTPGASTPSADAEPETRSEYPTYVEQLRAELAEKDKQLREYIAAYKDAVGKGLEEVKARLRRESDKEIERTRNRLLADLLEVVDNLDRSLAAAGAARSADAMNALVHGVRQVHAQFVSKLSALGARRMDTAGETFDPRTHEAIGTMPGAEGQVVHEVRAGYLVGDQVLRPAQVIVGKSPG